MVKFYYAVKNGRNPGIYNTWDECENEVKGFPGAKYKKFKTYEEAVSFLDKDDLKSEDIDIKDLKDDEIVAYVDGSFSVETKVYSYGIVIFTNEGKITLTGKDNEEELAEMRNVAGELKGAMEAMKYSLSKGKTTLYLYYDYMGIEQWAKGNWKTNKAGTKAYKEYYDSIKDRLNVVFIKVLAHSGIEYNEEADQLAKKELSQ